jgi:hypothetical protein
MGKISHLKKLEIFHKIYIEICNEPLISHSTLAKKIGISRNTARTYIQGMIQQNILIPPFLVVRPHPSCASYMNLLTFENPDTLFLALKSFPTICSSSLCAFDWNLMTLSSSLLDYSRLRQYQSTVFQHQILGMETPSCGFVGKWSLGSEVDALDKRKSSPLSPLSFHETDWKLFHVFKDDFRCKYSSILKKEKISYHRYQQWTKKIGIHFTVHALFYPYGFSSYTHWLFLFETGYDITRIFDGWPASCIFFNLGDHLLAYIPVLDNDHLSCLLELLQEMRNAKKVASFHHAILRYTSPQDLPLSLPE